MRAVHVFANRCADAAADAAADTPADVLPNACADIFPDAKAGSAAMTCEEFFSGKDADPKMISMDRFQIVNAQNYSG